MSVRKAALVALSRLLELFPQENSLTLAWVRSALPGVRDVEGSIQDALLDWGEALLLQRSADAAAMGEGPGSEAAAAAALAAADVRPLLAALATMGRSAASCVAKVCPQCGQAGSFGCGLSSALQGWADRASAACSP